MNKRNPDEQRVVTVWVRTDRAGSKYEIEIKVAAEDWDEFKASEKDAYVWAEITNRSMIEWGWRE
jgi:hypothetical protein